MPSLSRTVANWFAAETHPVNLAVVRITVFGILFETLRDGGFRRYARLPVDLRFPPPGWDTILRVFPLDEVSVTGAQIAAAIFAFLALIGFWTRPAAAVATLIGAYVLVTPYLFGKVNHTLHHLIWFGALLAASPAGDALSVDAWLARRRGKSPPGPARAGFHKLLAGPCCSPRICSAARSRSIRGRSPRFDRIRREPVKVRMEARLESESGSRPVKLPLRLSSVGRILSLPEGEERTRHLRALIDALLARHGPLQPGQSLRIYRSSYSTLPEDRRSPPLRREVVFAYPAGDDARPRHRP